MQSLRQGHSGCCLREEYCSTHLFQELLALRGLLAPALRQHDCQQIWLLCPQRSPNDCCIRPCGSRCVYVIVLHDCCAL